MLLLTGPSGSGKTTIAAALHEQGYKVIPTYTTREQREDDKFSVSISPKQFADAVRRGSFLTHTTVHTIFGPWSYGMRLCDFTVPYEHIVAVCVQEYISDFQFMLRIDKKDKLFIAYLDVDDETILQTSYLGKRGDADKDIQSRINRDRIKNEKTKSIANLVIDNHGFRKSVNEVTTEILKAYSSFYGKEAWQYEANAWDYI